MNELDLTEFELIDIKQYPLDEKDAQRLKELTGNFESLFSRRAQLYRQKGLKDMDLTEEDYKKYLLEHYTFLKRPVLIDENRIYVGSSPKNKKELVDNYGK